MPKDTNHPCGYCEFSSKKKSNVNRHIKTVHEKRRDYKCSMCDYAAGARKDLSKHTKLVHEKIKDIKCEECDYKCSLVQHLTIHVKLVHKRIREYECTICGKQLSTNNKLKKHIKAIHKKEDTESENVQENAKDQGDQERNHVKTKPKVTVKDKMKEHECKECGDMFSKLSKLMKHISKKHHKIGEINDDTPSQVLKADKTLNEDSQESFQGQGDYVTETTCQMCGFKSSKKSELVGHYYVHFPVRDINLDK